MKVINAHGCRQDYFCKTKTETRKQQHWERHVPPPLQVPHCAGRESGTPHLVSARLQGWALGTHASRLASALLADPRVAISQSSRPDLSRLRESTPLNVGYLPPATPDICPPHEINIAHRTDADPNLTLNLG